MKDSRRGRDSNPPEEQAEQRLRTVTDGPGGSTVPDCARKCPECGRAIDSVIESRGGRLGAATTLIELAEDALRRGDNQSVGAVLHVLRLLLR